MANKIKEIELMYFEDCPSWIETYQYLDEILNYQKIGVKIHLKKVETNEDAIKFEFPGSPTIKVNGVDIFPTDQTNYALGCRIYDTPHGFKGSPTKEMISKKLLAH